MSTQTWAPAPSGYLQNPALGARPVLGGECGRVVVTLAPAKGSGLPVAGFGVPLRTATPFGIRAVTHVSTPDFGTTLGLPSSRRPSS